MKRKGSLSFFNRRRMEFKVKLKPTSQRKCPEQAQTCQHNFCSCAARCLSLLG